MTDDSGQRLRRQRSTWMIGGIGLVVCGVIGMLQYSVVGMAQASGLVLDALFASSVLVFAIGSSRAASVVRREPLGMVALVVVAVWPLVMRVVAAFLPPMGAETFDAGLEAYRAAEGTLTAVFYVNLLVSLAAALLACVRIARAGVVPAPWNRAPLWALIASVAAGVVPQLLFAASRPGGAQGYAEIAILIGAVGFLARTLGLGIIALVLAARVRSGSVDVYRPT
ncbi:hypothetical protein N3K63_12175 [Microbacterium sp. W1N]|uniref:hypothetical protein n=1 Tax=Microbacterium festucae TaxID=2977531 RepID=UPI0021BE62CD|nr:hypothetical protein [Microbacterium festucae]MCT9821036.1 hypothetical protein [Microbacterium festucae]